MYVASSLAQSMYTILRTGIQLGQLASSRQPLLPAIMTTRILAVLPLKRQLLTTWWHLSYDTHGGRETRLHDIRIHGGSTIIRLDKNMHN
jgi:hypothetical protein